MTLLLPLISWKHFIYYQISLPITMNIFLIDILEFMVVMKNHSCYKCICTNIFFMQQLFLFFFILHPYLMKYKSLLQISWTKLLNLNLYVYSRHLLYFTILILYFDLLNFDHDNR